MSRVFGFVEGALPKQNRSAPIGIGKKIPKPEEGCAREDILKTGDFGQLNEDRLDRNVDRLYWQTRAY
jgi:hypothetical protein